MKYIRSLLLLFLTVLVLNIPLVTVSAAPLTSTNQTLSQCLRYSGHIYEVCSAYISNSSIGALEPYYKYSRGGSPWLTAAVSDHLAKRYVGSALQTATNRAANFPVGWYDIDGPQITVLNVTSNLATNQATLQTQESWTVRASNGSIVYQEINKTHNVVMQRVPSYVLHKWVVTSF